MKNIIRFLFAFLFSIFAVSCITTAPIKVTKLGELPDKINLKDLPTSEQYPDSDGVILYENIIYDVDYVPSVGIETYKTYHQVFRVFRDVENFMEQYIALDDDTVFESFTARTIKPDGTTVELTEEDIYYWKTNKKNNDHESSFEVAAYNIPKLEEGDLFEIRYVEINSFFYFTDKYFIQSRLPKKFARFEIKIPNFIFDPPSPFYFDYVTRNISVDKPEYSKGFGDSGDRTYVWTKTAIPAFQPEPQMGLESNFQGHIELRLSRWNTWKYYGSKHYERYYEEILENMSGEEERLISEKKNEFLKTASNDLEKIKILYNYVQTYPYSKTHVFFGHGHKPNEIKTILERGYGDCKDHAVLLTALLRSAGFTAWLALINADEKETIDPEFVTDIFNHVIVKVYLDGGQVIWLDPTAPYTPFGKLPEMDEGSHSIEIRPKDEVKDKKITLLKAPQSLYSDHLTKNKISGRIEKNTLIYNISVSFFGNNAENARHMFSVSSKKQIKEEIREKLTPVFFNAEISDITIKNLKEFEKPAILKFNIRKNIEDPKNIMIFPLKLEGNPADPNEIYRENRLYPLKLRSIFTSEVIFTMTYEDKTLELSKKKIDGKIKFMDAAQWESNLTDNAGKITYRYKYQQKKKEISSENVTDYLKNLLEVNKHFSKAYALAFIEKKPEIEENKPPEPTAEIMQIVKDQKEVEEPSDIKNEEEK